MRTFLGLVVTYAHSLQCRSETYTPGTTYVLLRDQRCENRSKLVCTIQDYALLELAYPHLDVSLDTTYIRKKKS